MTRDEVISNTERICSLSISIMLEKQFLSFQTVSLDIENLRVDFCHQDPPSYYTFN